MEEAERGSGGWRKTVLRAVARTRKVRGVQPEADVCGERRCGGGPAAMGWRWRGEEMVGVVKKVR